MKIGLIIYGSLDTLSGGYLYDHKLVEYLRSQGDTVEIISLPWRNYAAHLLDNFRFRLRLSNVIAKKSCWSSRPVGFGAHRDQKARKQALRVQGLDIMIQDELNHPSLIFANREKHLYPVISLVHHLRCSELRPEWQNAFYRWVERSYLRSVDGFVFNSKTTREAVHSLIHHEQPSIIAYPPTDRFGDPVSEQEIIERTKSNDLRILFLGNVIRRKGLHTLLEAVGRVKRDTQSGSSYRVDVVGSLDSDPAYSRQIQRMITNRNLSSFVFMHGALDKELLREKLRQAHVLGVPSSYEGFGIVYLEGMCFGLPAIGTTAGAAGEIISDGVDGFLIEPGNVDLLAGRLKSLKERRDVLLQMSFAARNRYLRQPKWEQTALQVREFLLKQIQEFSV